MELLRFDGKTKLHNQISPLETVVTARIHSASIFIDSKDITTLQKQGCFGHKFGERQDRVAAHLQKDIDGNQIDIPVWKEKVVEIPGLRLSPEETAYLALKKEVLQVFRGKDTLIQNELWAFLLERSSIEKMAVYFKLRRLGWIVRSGMSFGCHYIIYRDGPESYHASAAVKINSSFSSEEFLALNRILFNVKKACIMTRVTVPPSLPISNFSCLPQVIVEFITTSTLFPQPQMYI